MVASVFSKSPRRGTAGFQGKRLGKTHIGELFVKERVLKLPSPWPDRIRIAIGERHLRLLITSLIVLFLLMLGSSLLVQLTDSRVTHVAEQNRLSALHGQLVAQRIKAREESRAAQCSPKPNLSTFQGRLDYRQKRLEAQLATFKATRAPLEAFYAGLSDQQKASWDDYRDRRGDRRGRRGN